MLLRLHIHNLILVDQCDVTFTKGFNVITGETGSGKSVLLTAISLLIGERADPDLIRHGEEKATLIGEFDTPLTLSNSDILPLLEEYSLEDVIESKTLILKREILSSGKSKAYINDHLVPVSVIKQIGERLVEFSGQHAHMIMKDESYPLAVIDCALPGMEERLTRFQTLYKQERGYVAEIKKIESELQHRDAEIERLEADIQEITSSKILETDVEELFQRFSTLNQLSEVFQALQTISDMLEGVPGKHAPVLSICLSLQNMLERSKHLDSSLEAALSHVKSSTAELSEASFILKKRLSHLGVDEAELTSIEEKLNRIEKVERRWGKDKPSIQLALEKLQQRVSDLQRKDIELEELQASHKKAKKELDILAEEMHEARSQIAEKLQGQISHELKDLNMAACIFEIEVKKGTRTETGDTEVQFYITPNIGEKRVPIASGASGGEMARIYLAIQTVTSSLQKIPTIIFDEVDANIGGVTAIHVGRKLAAIGSARQVLAITHFHQVAESAVHHITIQKKEERGRTYTTIRALHNLKEREQEKMRMVGVM